MDSHQNIPDTIDNQLEGLRRHRPEDLRSQDLDQQDGTPDMIPAVEQVQATWAPGAPETAFEATPPENEDEQLSAQSVRPERDPEESWRDEDLEELDAHSSLDL